MAASTSKKLTLRRVAGYAAIGLFTLVLIAALNIRRIVRYAMTPSGPFISQTPPTAPDYADPRNWSALPDRDDYADRSPTGSPAHDPRTALVDVFFVHPTSYVGSRWNASTVDASLNDATDRVATGIQASAFNACCAVYAPRYRQANGTAFTRPSGDGDRAIELAYRDVGRAFESFNARRGGERPFILASHSQGTFLAERLMQRVISGTAFRDRMVAAYLIGGPVTIESLHERTPDIAPCREAEDTHCVISWNARSADYLPGDFEPRGRARGEPLCTNPLTWLTNDTPAPASRNEGAVFLESDSAPRLGFADAQCSHGTLLIRHIGRAPRDLPSRILDHVLGAGNYHSIEYQIFFMNIRRNASARVDAYIANSVR